MIAPAKHAFVILCAGLSERMQKSLREAGNEEGKSKVMMSIGGESFIQRTIRIIKELDDGPV